MGFLSPLHSVIESVVILIVIIYMPVMGILVAVSAAFVWKHACLPLVGSYDPCVKLDLSLLKTTHTAAARPGEKQNKT